jgi:hypothetical protein
MSYKNLIDANLNKAFNLLKDLAEDGVVVKTRNISYNFAAAATESDTSDIPVKFVVVDAKRDHKDVSMTSKTILLKAKVVGDLNTNDRINIGTEVWKFAHVLQSDGYITQAEIARES